MVKLLIAVSLVLLPGWACAFARDADTIRCVVGVFDAGVKGWGIHALPIQKLGEFDADATDGSITSRAFSLRGTGLYVHAIVSSRGDTQPSAVGVKPLSFSLFVSRRVRLNARSVSPRQVSRAASADVRLGRLETISVSTVVPHRGRPLIVMLDCRNSIER